MTGLGVRYIHTHTTPARGCLDTQDTRESTLSLDTQRIHSRDTTGVFGKLGQTSVRVSGKRTRYGTGDLSDGEPATPTRIARAAARPIGRHGGESAASIRVLDGGQD